ncbi:hypothetical protein Leryth_016503 [Lithospermum erythrorhizon]|nr:hypothetical protein Leryth_016503 [Lithospermum erythrorhizon]
MALLSSSHALIFTFGILGNIVSFLVYLSPLPTFYRVVKKKSTEEFQSIPYVAALFSSMLWIYYATVKVGETLLITINTFGIVIETVYLVIYIVYAPRKPRVLTAKLLFLSIGGFFSILSSTHFLSTGSKRAQIIGWICMTTSASVFIAPLTVIKQVIRTKSVEFMPFWLSFTLGLSAIMWFFYGMLLNDFYVMIPNVLGLIFSILQMALYIVYKHIKGPLDTPQEPKLPITATTMEKPCNLKNIEIHPVCSLPDHDKAEDSLASPIEDETKDDSNHETVELNVDDDGDCRRNVPDQIVSQPPIQVIVCG